MSNLREAAIAVCRVVKINSSDWNNIFQAHMDLSNAIIEDQQREIDSGRVALTSLGDTLIEVQKDRQAIGENCNTLEQKLIDLKKRHKHAR